MKTRITAEIIVAAVITSCSSQAQDDTTTNFLNAVHANSISSPEGDAALVRIAHLACQEMRAGANGNAVANEIGLKTGMDKEHAARFLFISADYFCPEQDHRGIR
jgi:Protein of unknown function (DUF732)